MSGSATGAGSGRVRPFGDAAYWVPLAGLPEARALGGAVASARLEGTAPAGMGEAIVGFDSLVVCFDPEVTDGGALAGWLAGLASAPPEQGGGREEAEPTGHLTIPVVFDGPDLDQVASLVDASPGAVAELLTGVTLEVALLGFSPGFPYLVGLPAPLAAVPRRATPRPAVAAGAVAVGGGFASVYPWPSPGGWMILGHTPARLFDPHHPPYARLRPGDTVAFTAATTGSDPTARSGGDGARSNEVRAADPDRGRSRLAAGGVRTVEVVEPGVLTLVEDAGRVGVAALGVPMAGPADRESMQLANGLVGNDGNAACLEVTVRGPTLRFGHPAHVAVVASTPGGIEVDLDDHPVGADLVVPVQAGQVLTVGRVRSGLRAYVAVSGGIRTPPVVGSRSSDQLSGLGPGPLRAGDRFEFGRPVRPHGWLSRPPETPERTGPVRVVPGPHPFPAEDLRALWDTTWSVAPDSNRIGLRLDGTRLGTTRPAVTSTGMVTGAVQVPPDGGPIVLLVDHATLGGYPVIGGVVTADLPRLGQARPGDRLTFVAADADEARRDLRHRARALARSVSGWFPTETAT